MSSISDEPATDSSHLSHAWSMWYHKLDDDHWNISSYRKVFTFNTVQDYWRMANNMPSVFSGMYFVMRENILPIYEDDSNLAGGVWSFRLVKRKLQDSWNMTLLHLIGNSLTNDMLQINGVSINPKNSVLKLWLRCPPDDPQHCNITTTIPFVVPNKALYMPHQKSQKPQTDVKQTT